MPAFDWYLVWLLGPIYLGFAVASFFLGLLLAQKLKRKRLIASLAALFLPLPLMLIANETWPRASAEVAWRYYEHLCSTYAGEKIYGTVENVEGVFIMRPKDRETSDYATDKRWKMVDPYGQVTGNSTSIWRSLASLHERSGQRFAYRFVEMPATSSAKDGLPYVRYEVVPTGRSWPRYPNLPNSPTQYEYKHVQTEVAELWSRHGFTWEDLTTPLLRLMWIGAGKTIVVELETNSVLAERTGFMFARTREGKRPEHPWTRSEFRCPGHGRTQVVYDFLFRVLEPNVKWVQR